MPQWVELCTISDISEDSLTRFCLSEHELILVRSAQGIGCFFDRCPHQDIKLSQFGCLHRGTLLCQAHGARFEPVSGEVSSGPTLESLRSYPVKIEDGIVWVDLGPSR